MPHPQVHLLPRYRRHAAGWPLLACLVLAGGLPLEAADQGAAPPATAQVANAQATANAVAKQIREQLDASVRLLDAGDPDAGKAALTRALELLGDSAARQQRPAVIKPLVDRAMGIRRRFAKAGIEVPATAALEGRSPPPAARGPQVGGRATISFVQHVVPILARSCGGCHVAGKKGDFQMVSYEALMRSGMVQRGAGASSRLVEVILTGDMPRGGGKISAADVDTLTRWIDAGAVCDAPDPTMPLEALARGGGRPLPPKADVRPVKLEPGGVSFAIDVAPVLATHCLKCHGGDETENGFSLATLETLLRGGRGGAAVVAGKGGTSLLVRKLKGADIEGQRMPLDAPPLSAATIATIEKWVDEGCRLDLLTGKSPLDTVVAAGRTRSLSDDALADVRAVAAEKAWRRSIPDDAPLIERRPGVCLIGNLPAARLANLADVAVQAASAVRGDLELEPEAPLLKGGVVLFIAGKSYDYSAVWQTMLGGERPRGLTSHSGVADEVAYGALLAPSADDPADAQAAITEAVVAAAFAGRSVPEWFARGAGRTIASRLCPKAPLVRGWRSEAGPAAAAVPVDHLLSGHAADPVAAAAVAGGVVGTIGTGPRLGQMLTRLDEGMPFEAAFEQTFSMSPDQACAAWTAKAARRR